MTNDTTSHSTTYFTTTGGEEVNTREHLDADELQVAGACLAVLLLFIFISNISCFYAVYKNKKNFLAYPFFQSNTLCMFLSCIDVCLALFVGVPGAIHLITAEQTALRALAIANKADTWLTASDDTLLGYNVNIAPYLLRYILFVQITIVCAVSADRLCNISSPLKYKFWVTKKKTGIIIVMCLLIPFIIDALPAIISSTTALPLPNGTDIGVDVGLSYFDIICNDFKHHRNSIRNSKAFSIPFTCFGNWNIGRQHGEDVSPTILVLETVEISIESIWVSITILTIILSNTAICIIILRSYRSNIQKKTATRKKSFTKSMTRNIIATVLMVFLVLPTILPTIIMRYVAYINKKFRKGTIIEDGKEDISTLPVLFFSMIFFLPPLLNPCLYPLRMESIRNFLPCLSYNKRGSTSSNLGISLKSRSATMLSSVVSFTRSPGSPTPSRGDSRDIRRADSDVIRHNPGVSPNRDVTGVSSPAMNRGLSSPSAASMYSYSSYGSRSPLESKTRTKGV